MLGLVGCVVLVASLPLRSVVAGLIVTAVCLAGRAVLRRPARVVSGAEPIPS